MNKDLDFMNDVLILNEVVEDVEYLLSEMETYGGELYGDDYEDVLVSIKNKLKGILKLVED